MYAVTNMCYEFCSGMRDVKKNVEMRFVEENTKIMQAQKIEKLTELSTKHRKALIKSCEEKDKTRTKQFKAICDGNFILIFFLIYFYSPLLQPTQDISGFFFF